jgi:hypothetical protein
VLSSILLESISFNLVLFIYKKKYHTLREWEEKRGGGGRKGKRTKEGGKMERKKERHEAKSLRGLVLLNAAHETLDKAPHKLSHGLASTASN